ncbi:MAG TPA: hypothetical protein VIG33_11105 [Pseudobdellovibrionaceae bacterium]|jgi:hypothetical protein
MNIRADSKEVKFRLDQEEVGVLLKEGEVLEKIRFPASQICFRIKFGEQTRVEQIDDEVLFYLALGERDKFQRLFEDKLGIKDPIVVVCQEIKSQKVSFKLEVDIFKPKQREQRK